MKLTIKFDDTDPDANRRAGILFSELGKVFNPEEPKPETVHEVVLANLAHSEEIGSLVNSLLPLVDQRKTRYFVQTGERVLTFIPDPGNSERLKSISGRSDIMRWMYPIIKTGHSICVLYSKGRGSTGFFSEEALESFLHTFCSE